MSFTKYKLALHNLVGLATKAWFSGSRKHACTAWITSVLYTNGTFEGQPGYGTISIQRIERIIVCIDKVQNSYHSLIFLLLFIFIFYRIFHKKRYK